MVPQVRFPTPYGDVTLIVTQSEIVGWSKFLVNDISYEFDCRIHLSAGRTEREQFIKIAEDQDDMLTHVFGLGPGGGQHVFCWKINPGGKGASDFIEEICGKLYRFVDEFLDELFEGYLLD